MSKGGVGAVLPSHSGVRNGVVPVVMDAAMGDLMGGARQDEAVVGRSERENWLSQTQPVKRECYNGGERKRKGGREGRERRREE